MAQSHPRLFELMLDYGGDPETKVSPYPWQFMQCVPTQRMLHT